MIAIHEAMVKMAVTGPKEELDRISDDLKYRPNGYHFAPSYERWRLSGGEQGWDGYVRPLKRVGSTQGSLYRGYRDTVLATCQTHGIKVDGSKLFPRPFEKLILADIPDDLITASFALDEHQRVAIHSWLVQGIGINQIVVAGGKTACFAGAAQMIKSRFDEACFLYLTPSERLVKQVTAEMRKFLPDFEVGQFGGGKDEHEAKDMVVCTVAMLNRHFPDLRQIGFFRRFMGLFYDEVHHCASATSEKIITQVAAYFRLGATDSAKDADPDRQSKMIGFFGSILNRVTAAPLLKAGRLAKPHVYVQDLKEWAGKFRDVPMRAQPETTAWCLLDNQWKRGVYLGPVLKTDKEGEVVVVRRKHLELKDDALVNVVKETPVSEVGLHRVELGGVEYEVESRWVLLHRMYDEAIVRFKPRNELVTRWATYFSSQGFPTLVVATRTLHIYLLEALIKTRVNPDLVQICFGWATPRQRDKTFEWFRNTPGSILITPLVKEGVSINEIRAGVVADYVGDVETAHQIVGRFMRKKAGPDNFAEIVWFRESQHPSLRRGSSRIIHQLGTTYAYPVYDPPPDINQLDLSFTKELKR